MACAVRFRPGICGRAARIPSTEEEARLSLALLHRALHGGLLHGPHGGGLLGECGLILGVRADVVGGILLLESIDAVGVALHAFGALGVEVGDRNVVQHVGE